MGWSRIRLAKMGFKNIPSLPFSIYQMFQKAELSCIIFLFIFLEKSKFKLHYVTQCNFPSPPH